MTDGQDVFRKVGRGGAGNFIPAKAASADKDIERQSPPEHIVTTEAVPPSEPLRAGRGGAGNFVDPDDLPGEEEKNRMRRDVTAAVVSSLKKHPHRGGLGGRGGAGNYEARQELEEQREKEQEGESQGLVKDLEEKVKETVDKGLKMPDKVHHSPSKN